MLLGGGCIPVVMADLAKYPFLPQAKQLITGLDFDLETVISIPRIRERAKQRVLASFDFKAHFSQPLFHDPQTEIASYALALAYASGIGDNKMIERFALYEAGQINEYLKTETHEDVILDIAHAFNWQVRVEEEKKQRVISIHFTKFLENSTRGRLHHDPKWKLATRALIRGWVRVSPYEVARLLQEEVRTRIEENAKLELTYIPQQMQVDIEELRTEFLKRKPTLEEFDQIVRAQESEYPPCITGLLKRAATGQHMSHVERFTLVTYLLHQGVSVDSIVNLFSGVSDFNEEKSRYQVEHLAGRRYGENKPYVTYNCSSLQTHGVCSGPADQICKAIKNPLTYHLRKQRKRQAVTRK
jgi:DNA primase large subunit